MGLHLTGKGSILDAIGGAANTFENAVVSGERDVGDLGSAGLGAITGNQQAVNNASNAITSNDQNLSGRSLPQNIGGLGSDILGGFVNPIVRPVVGLGVGLGEEANSALYGKPLGGYSAEDANNPLGAGFINYATNNGQTDPTAGRQLGSNLFLTALNTLTAGKGAALEQGVEHGVAGVLGDNTASRIASRVAGGAGAGAAIGGGYGAGAAIANAQNPGQAASEIIKSAGAGAALGGAGGLVSRTPAIAQAVKDNPLNEVGGIKNPLASPDITPDELVSSPEDLVHQNNPLAPTEAAPPAPPEPSATDLEAAHRAAEQIDNAPAPVDFSQVEGAGQRLTQAVKGRANAIQQADRAAGIKRTRAHYLDQAERGLKSGKDGEALDYQQLERLAQTEKDLKSYQQADTQSGYNKVKLRNAPAGSPKYLPSWIREKISSPEYASKRNSGLLLQRIRDELPQARAHVDALNKQIKMLSKKGDINGIKTLNDQNADARLRLRSLEGMERAQSGEYGRLAETLDQKYPDAILKKPGTRSKVTVSGAPVAGIDRPVESTVRVASTKPAAAVSEKELKPEDYQFFDTTKVEPYTGPNLNKDAFSPEDIKNLMSHNGQYEDEAGSSYSPHHDLTLPSNVSTPAPRNLGGDTAAFEALADGGKVEDAVKAYQKTTGAAEDEAREAVNTVAETGADMGSNEDVLRRNPEYDKVPDFATPTVEDVNAKGKSYRNTSELLEGEMNKAAKGMSEHDVQLLDNLRGNSPESVAREADDPEQFMKVAQAAKNISDYNHEIRRQNGDTTIYRQNYGAGMHYAANTPEEQASVSGYRDTLASTPGFSRERLIGNYEKAAKEYGLSRQNANFLEDVSHDTRQTLAYVHDRSIFRGLQDAQGNDVVHYGNPDRDHPVQLNGTRDVFASRDVAKAWNKLNPEAKDKTIFGKAYDATSTAVIKNIVFNPLFHGGNQLWQAGEAAGKLEGPVGLGQFAKELGTTSKERMLEGARGIYEHGGDIPDYGKDNNSIISRMTHGGTDLAPKAMAAIEFRVRTSLYNVLTDGGMDGREAVKTIETFLGDSKTFDLASHRLTIFLHYFKTLTNVQLQQVLHPVKYAGTIANKAAMLGVLYGVNYAWQKFTGNPHASVRAPGGAGLIKEEIGSAENIAKGKYLQGASIFTNRVNPIPKEVAQQAFNKDLFTGQSLDQSGGRAQHALNTLISPVQSGSRVVSGKKSPAELVANELQLNTPHAAGAPAAPSGRVNILNTKGSKPATGADATGIDQQNNYFDSLGKAQQTLKGSQDGRTLAQFNTYITRNHDQKGDSVQLSPADSMHQWGTLYANDKLLGTVQSFEKAQPNHNPIWDLSPAQLKTYAQYESVVNGEPQRTVLEQKNPWLTQTFANEQKWSDQQTFSGNSVAAAGTPVYPTLSDSQNSMMNQVNQLSAVKNRTPAQTTQLETLENNPDLQAAYHALDTYTNQERVAKGYTPINYPAPLSQADEAAFQQYLALPKDTGAKTAWINANPAAWNRIQSSLATNTLFDIESKGGLYELQGETPTSSYLKQIYDAGQYDIAPPLNTGGDYTVDPTAAYTASQNSPANKLADELIANNQRREAANSVKYAGRTAKIRVKTNSQNKRKLGIYSKPKGAKIARAQTGKLRIKSVPIS